MISKRCILQCHYNTLADTFRLKYADLSGIRLPLISISKNNLSEIHISQGPEWAFPSLSYYGSWSKTSNLKAEGMIIQSPFIRMPCWTVISPRYRQYGRIAHFRQWSSSHRSRQNSFSFEHISSSSYWSHISCRQHSVVGMQSITCKPYRFNSTLSCCSSFVRLWLGVSCAEIFSRNVNYPARVGHQSHAKALGAGRYVVKTSGSQ